MPSQALPPCWLVNSDSYKKLVSPPALLAYRPNGSMPSSFASASQAAMNSSQVLGGLSGSRPAWVNRSALYHSIMLEPPQVIMYCLPSYWPASIMAGYMSFFSSSST